MPAELTDHFKIFKSDYAVPGNSADFCMLSAHGAGLSNAPATFTVPNDLTLLFPADLGEAVGVPPICLVNVGGYNGVIANVLNGRPDPLVVRTVPGGQQCENYELAKFQGRHQSKWPGLITYPITRKESWKNTFGDEHYSDIEAAVANLNADVVTVRNRWKWHTPTLYDLVNFLDVSLVYNYRYLFCSFCLSTACCSPERWHHRDQNTGCCG